MALNAKQQQDVTEFVKRLRNAAGDNLVSAVLYGSGAGPQQHPADDINVLGIFRALGATELKQVAPVVSEWRSSGHTEPMLMTESELRDGADVFAIELMDMQARHQVLYGQDVVALLQVPMQLHHLQVERELRQNTIRLRQHALAAQGSDEKLLRLMRESLSSFTTLLRHALIALGEPAVEHRHDAVERLAARLGFEAAPFQQLLDVRDGKADAAKLDVQKVFAGYLSSITRVTNEVDKRLAARTS
jgi:hypothetical protein